MHRSSNNIVAKLESQTEPIFIPIPNFMIRYPSWGFIEIGIGITCNFVNLVQLLVVCLLHSYVCLNFCGQFLLHVLRIMLANSV